MGAEDVAEELRRKHIETLEVLQTFADENEALKVTLAASGAKGQDARPHERRPRRAHEPVRLLLVRRPLPLQGACQAQAA